MKLSTVLFAAVLIMSVSACGGREERPEDSGPINFERNSVFTGPNLRVFLTLEDGTPLTVNTADDAVETSPGSTPLPGHQARDWVFVKDDENGTSIVYALVSWDPLDTPDYLLAGWWAQFPDQHYPDISFSCLACRIENPLKTSMFSRAFLVAGARYSRDRHTVVVDI